MAGFDLDGVRREVAGTRFAQVEHFASVGSTNVDLMAAAHAGAVDGTVYVADEQTAGRGRGGHSWVSSVGDGLYVSVLVRPRAVLPMERALWVSLATGVAAKRALDAELAGAGCADRADIRWPNDLILNAKKCGGILVESAVAPEAKGDGVPAALRFAVIGIGLNLNHAGFPEELAVLATSLRIAAGRRFARESVLVRLLGELDEELTALEADAASGGDGLLARFAQASSWARGKRVRVDEAGGYTGVTAGLDSQGFLRVSGDDGVARTVLSGGVRPV